jgi:hypothetical protein
VCDVIGGEARSIDRHRYRSYGLTIEVPFACADLAAADANASVDVVVRDGVVGMLLPSAVVSEPNFDAAPGSFLHRGGPRAGRYLVCGGDQVFVQRHPRAEAPMLAQQFTASLLPAILRQRGLLVLHANAAVVNQSAVLIGGESGAGKSTTLAALLDRGAQMLSDDVSALALGENARIEALPGPARLRLAPASRADEIAGDGRRTRPYKTVLATEPSMAASSAPLRAVYVLRRDRGDTVTATALSGGDKLEALLECMYGPVIGGEHAQLFPVLRAVLEHVPVFALRRPEGRWSVDEVADHIVDAGTVFGCCW